MLLTPMSERDAIRVSSQSSTLWVLVVCVYKWFTVYTSGRFNNRLYNQMYVHQQGRCSDKQAQCRAQWEPKKGGASAQIQSHRSNVVKYCKNPFDVIIRQIQVQNNTVIYYFQIVIQEECPLLFQTRNVIIFSLRKEN